MFIRGARIKDHAHFPAHQCSESPRLVQYSWAYDCHGKNTTLKATYKSKCLIWEPGLTDPASDAPTHEAGEREKFQVYGQPGLHSEFQPSKATVWEPVS